MRPVAGVGVGLLLGGVHGLRDEQQAGIDVAPVAGVGVGVHGLRDEQQAGIDAARRLLPVGL